MAVTKVPGVSTLRLELQTGTSGSGNPVYRIKSLSNVKPDAADQDIYAVAAAVAQLQDYPLHSINRVDSAQLIDTP